MNFQNFPQKLYIYFVVFDDIKKYTDDLLKKKEGSEESVSDVDASCDIDDVIDEIDAEESEDK